MCYCKYNFSPYWEIWKTLIRFKCRRQVCVIFAGYDKSKYLFFVIQSSALYKEKVISKTVLFNIYLIEKYCRLILEFIYGLLNGAVSGLDCIALSYWVVHNEMERMQKEAIFA